MERKLNPLLPIKRKIEIFSRKTVCCKQGIASKFEITSIILSTLEILAKETIIATWRSRKHFENRWKLIYEYESDLSNVSIQNFTNNLWNFQSLLMKANLLLPLMQRLFNGADQWFLIFFFIWTPSKIWKKLAIPLCSRVLVAGKKIKFDRIFIFVVAQ